jgi:hypothetical protein
MEQEILPVGDIANNYSPNPMVRRHGRGPEGARCKTCRYLQAQRIRSRRSYWKCVRYSMNHSTASDFRKKWDACRLYEEGE